MRGLDANTIAALEAGHFRCAYLVDIEFDSNPLYLSTLYSDLVYDSKTYVGAGNLGQISNTSENTGLEPSNVTITLSAINAAILPTVFSQEYINRPASIRLILLDDSGSVIGEIPYYNGIISSLSLEYGATASIQIELSDQLSVWNRRKVRRYTDQDQKASYPSDRGFEFVEQIQDMQIVWPAKEFFD